jgi:hypothetical protein
MNTAIFAPIINKERQSDGTLIVTGVATDDTLDIDQQICDPAWLERAMPEWFKYGNIREQHSNIAAGVATKLEQDGSQHIVTARVVDPNSVMKVESGVLRGFSIGIRDPRIAKDKAAPGGRIVDGEIVEVSLVDRPANPSCLIELAKSVGGNLRQVETLVMKESAVERCASCGKAYKSDDLDDDKMCKMCKMDEASEQSVGDETTEASEEDTAMAAESSEMSKESEESEMNKEPDPKMMDGKEDSEMDEHISEEMSLLGSISQALARIEEMLGSAGKVSGSSMEDTAKSIKSIDERLSKVEKSASRGPVRAVVKAVLPQQDENLVKAAAYRQKAATSTDPSLVKGYLALAADLEKNG